jgi:hypothetical protein
MATGPAFGKKSGIRPWPDNLYFMAFDWTGNRHEHGNE